MDVQVPAAGVAGSSGVGVVDEPPPPAADPRTNEAPVPGRRGRGRAHRLVPAVLPERARELAVWSHTRPALVLGTAITVAGGLVAVVSLIVVGFVGAGTHVPSWYAQQVYYSSSAINDSTGVYGPTQPFPPDLPEVQPQLPAVGGPIDTSLALSQALAGIVLQPSDLSEGFVQRTAGPTGADPTRGLIASFHAYYERPSPAVARDGTVSILSVIGRYDTSEAASFHLRDLDVARLGADAGLPSTRAELVSADTVGDESRVVHLTTAVVNAGVGAYLIQFRRGAYEAVVGVIAPLGSESLQQALQLAQTEDAHLRLADS